jgi:3-dehydroquinate synthase
MSVAIPVPLGDRAYEVVVGRGLLAEAGDRLGPLLRRPRVAIIADATAWDLHGAPFQASLEARGIHLDVILVPPGEASKSFARFEIVVEALLALEIERGDLIVAFGGGVAGDLAGFAAGVVKRGIDFVQVPTTLLAQVDSSVGGKTAINARAGKNMVGLFWQPRLVLADLDALATLPRRDLAAGWAEVVKYGLIDDPAFFDWCAGPGVAALDGDVDALAHAVATSVAAKARIVAADEREGGVRALLNLGHTFGHAFEAGVDFDEGVLRHGEAVAVGVAMAHRFSARLGLCPAADAERVSATLRAAGLPATPADIAVEGAPWDPDALAAAMAHDKKNEGGALTLILSHGIGRAFVRKRADAGEVRAFLGEDVKT